MTAGTYDIAIEQGATFSRVLTWRDASGTAVNLTGYTARMMLRESAEAATPFLTLTTENGGIALGSTAGTITLTISAAATSALALAGGVYDLELVAGSGTVTRLLQGTVLVSREVTR